MTKTNLFSLPANKEKASLKEQICDHFIAAIESGKLPPGSILPPTRELAVQFGVARDTVVRAYAELKRLTYIESSSTRHYKVASRLESRIASKSKSTKRKPKLSNYGKSILKDIDASPLISEFAQLNYGGPPLELLPTKRWQDNMKFFARLVKSIDHKPQILGRQELRKALAAYLNRTKQMHAFEDEMIIFTSTISAMNLFCRLLLNPGDYIAVENPGFGGIRNVAAVQNLNLYPVPVDDDGIVVSKLNQAKEPIKLIYVTPSHQEPTGAVMSLARRRELVEWATKNNSWIIEDDFDGFFDYTRARLPSLKALDQADCVIHLSTMWRILYPLTCLGYCVVPDQLVPIVFRSKLEVEGVSESITQLSLAKLIDDGYLEKYSRKLRSIYKNRRNQMLESLRTEFDDSIQIIGGKSGTQLMVKFEDVRAEEVIRAANHAKLPFISTGSYYLRPQKSSYFLVDYSILKEEEIAGRVVELSKHLF